MTVSTSNNTTVHDGNDVADEFDFTFKVLEEDHLVVERRLISTGLVDKTYLQSEYTVVGIGDDNGGSITLLDGALSSDYQIIITRVVDYTQELDIVNQGGFYPETVETQLDLLEMQIQQLAELTDRAIILAPGEEGVTLPAGLVKSGMYLYFDDDGLLTLSDAQGPKGDPGGNTMAVGLFVNLDGLDIDAGVEGIYSTGYSVVGRGRAFYFVDATLDDAFLLLHPRWTFQSLDGRRWRLQRDGVNIEMLGAIPSVSASFQSAIIQEALDNFTEVEIPGKVELPFWATGLTSGVCRRIHGSGALATNVDAPILTMESNWVDVDRVWFLGDGKGTVTFGSPSIPEDDVYDGKENQHGIKVEGFYFGRLNARGVGLSGALYYLNQATGDSEGNTISGEAHNCHIGVYADERAEYIKHFGFTATGCNYGARVRGGNFVGAASNLSRNVVGFDLLPGDNDSHGIATGMMINHNTSLNIRGRSIANGYHFIACEVYEAAIYLSDCTRVLFAHCFIDVNNYYLSSSVVEFTDNTLPFGYSNAVDDAYNAEPSQVTWDNNKGTDGHSTPGTPGYRGGYCKATCGSDLSAVTTGNTATILFPTQSINAFSRTTVYTITDFYDATTGEFTVDGTAADDTVEVSCLIKVDIAGATKDGVFITIQVNGTNVAYVPVYLVSGLYHFQFEGKVRAVGGDKIRFRLTNNSGGNATVKGSGDNYISCEGL